MGGGGGGANDGGRGGGANDAWEGSRPRARPWAWECYQTSRCKSTPPAPYPDRLVLAPVTARLKCHTASNKLAVPAKRASETQPGKKWRGRAPEQNLYW